MYVHTPGEYCTLEVHPFFNLGNIHEFLFQDKTLNESLDQSTDEASQQQPQSSADELSQKSENAPAVKMEVEPHADDVDIKTGADHLT
jgi:hypothetical protein